MDAPWSADAIVTLRRRLVAIVARGRLRRHETPLALSVVVGLVLGLLVVHWAAVVAVAGAAGPVHHLAYPPILLAAYAFGIRGALVAAIVVSSVSGPWPVLVNPDPGSWGGNEVAALRVAMFVTVALITGILFDHLRQALDGWRTTAFRVTEREREGMVALARGAEAKDTDTGDHIQRVRLVTERLALAAALDAESAAALGWAAMLHDIGKLHVPDAILTKPGPLTREEEAIVRMHTVWGAEILANGQAFATARVVARSHHEDFDGSGYPDGLRGEAIALEARIVRIADAFDAMIHGRRYQPARSLEWAMDELRRLAGSKFDPEFVRLFIDLVEAGALRASIATGETDRVARAEVPAVLSERRAGVAHPASISRR